MTEEIIDSEKKEELANAYEHISIAIRQAPFMSTYTFEVLLQLMGLAGKIGLHEVEQAKMQTSDN